jgi:hypothetical protein
MNNAFNTILGILDKTLFAVANIFPAKNFVYATVDATGVETGEEENCGCDGGCGCGGECSC